MRRVAGRAVVLARLVFVGLAKHASAAESDETGAAEGNQTPPQPVSTDTICSALAAAAAQNDLPTDFFTRLIWQESRFDPAAVSRAGAQGVGAFMPATANWRGLSNPFAPLEAIAALTYSIVAGMMSKLTCIRPASRSVIACPPPPPYGT